MHLPRKVFSIVKVCDAESFRYALGGIRLERGNDGNPVAVATDGKRLIATSWTENGDDHPSSCAKVAGFETIVSGESVKQAVKAHKMTKSEIAKQPCRSGYIVTEDSPDGLTSSIIAEAGVSKTVIDRATIDGKFPKWRDVIKDHGQGLCKLDAKLLSETIAVVGAMGDGTVILSMNVENPEDSAINITSIDSDQKTVGVVMPLSGEKGHSGKRIDLDSWTPAGEYDDDDDGFIVNKSDD